MHSGGELQKLSLARGELCPAQPRSSASIVWLQMQQQKCNPRFCLSAVLGSDTAIDLWVKPDRGRRAPGQRPLCVAFFSPQHHKTLPSHVIGTGSAQRKNLKNFLSNHYPIGHGFGERPRWRAAENASPAAACKASTPLMHVEGLTFV
ncbi:hypothetical protein ACQKWADRAFT_285335 [Trichoderma austrokoningii]